ncbi:unnamed protein product, partial [Ectocarpus fasciculatus]
GGQGRGVVRWCFLHGLSPNNVITQTTRCLGSKTGSAARDFRRYKLQWFGACELFVCTHRCLLGVVGEGGE